MRHGWDFAGRSTAALHLTVLIAVWSAGCDVYEGRLVQQMQPSAMAGAPGPASGAGAAGMIAVNAGNGGTDGGPPVGPASPCENGECWWSKGGSEDCRSASMPRPDDRPTGDDDPIVIEDIYLGFSKIRLSDTSGDAPQGEDAWEGLGFDLDGLCTNSDTCEGTGAESCKTPGPAKPYDGALCRDNTFGRLQPVIAKWPMLGEKFGLTENALNCQLWRGGFNMLVRISGFNGRPSDPRVRVDYYLSTGLEEPSTWKCPTENFQNVYSRWRALRTWTVDDRSLTGPVSAPGTLPESTAADPDAYVKDGYLVSRVPDGTEQGFIGDGDPHRGFVFKARQGVFVGRLARAQDGTWQIDDGMLAGRIRKDELVSSFRQVGFCETADVNTFYQSMLEFLDETADVLSNGEVDPQADCDAVSYGIGFEANQLTPGKAVKAPPRVECCAPGESLENCAAKCGDGEVNRDELCDTAIPAGEPGACPATCGVNDACVPQMLVGSECSAECKPMAVSMTGAKDGCCPKGATVMTDMDCQSSCGNGLIEAGETCDPPSACACTETPCFTVRMTGSADRCNVRCEYVPIETCGPQDGCCPGTCSSDTDMDCSTTCGDTKVDPNETCESEAMPQCPATCDDGDPCTNDRMSGSANNCNVMCTHTKVLEPRNGDRCCPDEATANSDSDCPAKCGNGAIEPGEQCDDGNTVAGDGCVDCKMENNREECLTQLGKDDACARCKCQNCASQVAGCYVQENSEEPNRCRDLVECSDRVGCGNPDCYCGGASLFACFAGGGTGQCRRETELAARSDSIFDIDARSTDLNYPLGRSNAYFTCVERNCVQVCGRR